MDRVVVAGHLQAAERHVVNGEWILERQRALILRLEHDGHGSKATAARALLTEFEQIHARHIADRDRLRVELVRVGRIKV